MKKIFSILFIERRMCRSTGSETESSSYSVQFISVVFNGGSRFEHASDFSLQFMHKYVFPVQDPTRVAPVFWPLTGQVRIASRTWRSRARAGDAVPQVVSGHGSLRQRYFCRCAVPYFSRTSAPSPPAPTPTRTLAPICS